MKYLLLGLFAFFGMLFTWAPANALDFPVNTQHVSPDGKTYYMHPDNVFREAVYTGATPKVIETTKSRTIRDVYGNTYTLGADGYYRPQQQQCPGGRCPNQ